MLCDSSLYLCSCRYELVKTLGENGDFSEFTHIGALYFCPQCQALRCEECSDVRVKSKYCIRCMTDFSENLGQTRCLKNCFECPSCFSPVDVTSSDAVNEHGRGKQFLLKCVYCPFEYKTKVITRPAALQLILKRELPDHHEKVVAKYIAMYEVNNHADKKRTKQANIQRLEAMKIRQVDPENSFEKTIAENGPLDIMEPTPLYTPQPKGCKLAYKHEVRCHSCHHELMMPVPEIKLIKILAKNYASDILPTLTATFNNDRADEEEDISCSLSIVNNLSSSINVVISIYGTIPASLSLDPIGISLPVSTLSIQGKRDKLDVIDTIPTVLLGTKTKAAQAQQVIRGRLADTVEQGTNWATIPFVLSPGEDAVLPEKLRVPFHVEVETRLPDSWKLFSSKRGLRFSYWAITEIHCLSSPQTTPD